MFNFERTLQSLFKDGGGGDEENQRWKLSLYETEHTEELLCRNDKSVWSKNLLILLQQHIYNAVLQVYWNQQKRARIQ